MRQPAATQKKRGTLRNKIPPVTDALLQEAIDFAVILNALCAR